MSHDVRFTPESGHSLRLVACPLCAIADILASQRDVRSYLESGHLLASIDIRLSAISRSPDHLLGDAPSKLLWDVESADTVRMQVPKTMVI
jgi:hypothetical protein